MSSSAQSKSDSARIIDPPQYSTIVASCEEFYAACNLDDPATALQTWDNLLPQDRLFNVIFSKSKE